MCACVSGSGAQSLGIRRLAGYPRGLEYRSPDGCLSLQVASVFVLQLRDQVTAQISPGDWPRRVTWPSPDRLTPW